MPDVMTVKISGLDQIDRKLRSMPLGVARRLLRQAMRSAATIWRDEMQIRAPRGATEVRTKSGIIKKYPGFLAEHIRIQVGANSDLEGYAKVGPARAAFWGMFLEFGTGPRHKKSGAYSGVMPAHPFIRASYESKASAVLDKFVEEGRKIVAEEAIH
jgi:HK97 gp10 family phage protein